MAAPFAEPIELQEITTMRYILTLTTAAYSSATLAHSDAAHSDHSFVLGFMHPLTGIDHWLVAAVIGWLLAAAATRICIKRLVSASVLIVGGIGCWALLHQSGAGSWAFATGYALSSFVMMLVSSSAVYLANQWRDLRRMQS